MCSDAPDTSGMNRAAEANAEVAKDALEFYKGIYASDILPAQQKQADLADTLVADYLDTSRTQKEFAKDQKDYYEQTFKPVEQQMVADAQNYDSAANIQRKVGQATAGVTQQFSRATAQGLRELSRAGGGMNPAQAAKYLRDMKRAEALGSAGAGTAAANDVQDKAIALRSGVANFGRNMPNTASNYFSGANASNAGAFGTGQQAMANIGANASVVGQGFNTAIQGNQSAGSIYGQVAQIEGKDSGIWGALGGVAGQFAGSQAGSSLISTGIKALPFFSDKNMKTDVKPVSDDEALAAVKATPVSRWKYKQGMGDSGRHIGPMAQDVNRTMGDEAAPGARTIDPITVGGINMAATAALARKVDRLERLLQKEQA